MKLKPLQDRILVRREDAEEKTSGGIIIPDTSKEKPSKGIVVAVGDGARNDKGDLVPMTLKVGDRVFFTKWGGTELKVDDEELLIMKESDILATIE
ncbi:MAG: co-chaperone GroES [Rickettsiales bacterium]|jgi:chaperonin GroES|nr:co-chaperone GroES [Rickettsiales bacterium]